jgi:hypothetical protein
MSKAVPNIDPEVLEGVQPMKGGKNGKSVLIFPLQKVIPMSVNVPHPELQDQKPFSSFELCEPYRITREKDIPNPPPVITINGAAVAAAGNISAISAHSKTGKTAIFGVIIAGSINKTGIVDSFPEINFYPNKDEKAVMHMDTEQEESDQQNLVNTALRRNDFETTPDFLYSYNVRQLNLKDYQTFTDNVCALAAEKHSGLYIILIDGIADYILSVNDEEQANSILQYFIHLSIKYACPVIVTIHLNPFSEKERGHIGSQLQRKCYGLLTIAKDGETSILQAKMCRKAGNGDIPQIAFAYDKKVRYHVQVNCPDKEAEKDARRMAYIKELSKIIFAPPAAYKNKEALSKIMRKTNKSEPTANRYLKDMVLMEWVVLGNDKHYRLNTGTGEDEPQEETDQPGNDSK